LLAADAEKTDAGARFQALVPQAQLRVFEAGHDIVEDQPEQLADLVAGWLSASRPPMSSLARQRQPAAVGPGDAAVG